jgi:hypothetical protein
MNPLMYICLYAPPEPHCPKKKGVFGGLAFFLLFSEGRRARWLKKRRRRNDKMTTEEKIVGSLRLDINQKLGLLMMDYAVELDPESPLLRPKNKELVQFWLEHKLKKLEKQMKRDPTSVVIWAKNHMPSKATIVRRHNR